jgi:2-polyprenyl-3-methyl-5-hydroxy-6-metoxy-1,4-benzoquinol methylase
MYARTRLGLDVYIGELADATFPDEYFDLVTMWHVLEHLHDPRSTLVEAARVARPGGTLLLGLPDPESLEARLFGPHWAGWDFPRHLHILSQSVIRRMLKETGWQVFEIVGASGRMWLLNQSLRYWLENRMSSASLRRLILSISGSELVRAAFVPYFMLIERMNKGSAIAVFARRVS